MGAKERRNLHPGTWQRRIWADPRLEAQTFLCKNMMLEKPVRMCKNVHHQRQKIQKTSVSIFFNQPGVRRKKTENYTAGREGKADSCGSQSQEHKRMQVSKSLKGKKKRKESSMWRRKKRRVNQNQNVNDGVRCGLGEGSVCTGWAVAGNGRMHKKITKTQRR